MNRFYYDLHTHSCLSPCADDDNTPNNIAGIASLSGLHIVALTDHNSCKNCPAFFAAAERYGIIPIAGMEFTTSEDIHVVCLFESLAGAMRFDEEIQKFRTLIKNRKEIFGEQQIMNESDEIIGYDEYMLSVATSVSIEDLPRLVESFGGVCYPAHVDRDSNGIIAILGTLPETPRFNLVEFRDSKNIKEYAEKHGITNKKTIISSDAHYLTDIKDCENFFELEADSDNGSEVTKKLFQYLRSEL